MKKTASILLILAIFIQSTSQLWIWVSFSVNRNYIAAELCINRFDAIPVCKGSCVLEKRINEDQKQQQEKLPDLKNRDINWYFEGTELAVITPPVQNPSEKYIIYNDPAAAARFAEQVFHPPC